jgi:hypothetical protein
MDSATRETHSNIQVTAQLQDTRRDHYDEPIVTDTLKLVSQARPRPDRAAIRAELEASRIAFLALVDATSDERWQRKSPTTRWTEGQVLVHLTWALEQLPREVESARRGKGMFNFPKRVADPLSYWFTRWLARKATRESLAQRYDAAIAAVLATLEDVQDSEWERGARFYGERFYTVAELFHTPTDHLTQHTAGL